MRFEDKLYKGKFLKRYKRFFCDIKLPSGEEVTAHTPNTGSMKGLLTPDSDCYITHIDDPKRKLKYTLQMLKTPSSWVGVNTHLPNKLVAEAIEEKKLSHLKKYKYFKSEAKLNAKTRIDFALHSHEEVATAKKWDVGFIDDYKFHFIEVKNVTLAEENKALFPDSVTARGLKHIKELEELIEQGHTGEFLFVVQRTDCDVFSPAKEIDPAYSTALKEANKKGLTVKAFSCHLSKDEIYLDKEIKIKFD
ncbi:DNA/RNA nuclease SfsA [bacterium]|nr:DNA/RNA nuclease SfsA [bacterium]